MNALLDRRHTLEDERRTDTQLTAIFTHRIEGDRATTDCPN
jgi:hypothetical protein